MMKTMTQGQARKAIERLKMLGQKETMSQREAIEALELLDNLAYSYIRCSKPGSPIREAAAELEQAGQKIADQYYLCTCCYQPLSVCMCDMDWGVNDLVEPDDEFYDRGL